MDYLKSCSDEKLKNIFNNIAHSKISKRDITLNNDYDYYNYNSFNIY